MSLIAACPDKQAWMVPYSVNCAYDILLEDIAFERPVRGRNVYIQDISSLDPGDDEDRISGWGGLSGFSGRVADVVGEALREVQGRT